MAYTERPHQVTAIAAAAHELSSADRASVVMPCGTGKTLVGIETVRRLKPRITVLLAPTLALIGQSLQAWRDSDPVPGARYIAACSDESVAEGSRVEDDIAPDELGVMVTTSSDEVAGALALTANAPLIILTTYSSAPVVGRALLSQGIQADLAVFDESHRTATGAPSQFSSALFQDYFPAAKRLFLTATPRVYPVADDGPSISMDNQALYGKVAHVLSVSDAIKQGLIADYRILVSVVTTDELQDPGTDAVARHRQAAAVAISKAMKEFGLRKGFLFHRSVADAEAFSNSEVLARETGVQAIHINGGMSMNERLRLLGEFKSADRSLVTNAKCLTEGVDVPSVDLVCFMAPKKSTVDVVQAVGRAMRTAPGKRHGYVLLPMLVDLHKGETVEQAVARSEMSELFRVLSELRDMEIPFARSNRSAVISDESVKRSLDYFREKVVTLGSDEVTAALRNAISVMAVKELRSDWDEKFLALKRFKEAHGHLKFDPGSEESKELGKFVSNCRQLRLRGLLAAHKVEMLNDMEFPWDVEDARWDRRFVQATTLPRSKWAPKNYEWLADQKRSLADGSMPGHRLERLRSGLPDLFDATANKSARPDSSSRSGVQSPSPAIASPAPAALRRGALSQSERRAAARKDLFDLMRDAEDTISFRSRSSNSMAGMRATGILFASRLILLSGQTKLAFFAGQPDATPAEREFLATSTEAVEQLSEQIESLLEAIRAAIRVQAVTSEEAADICVHMNMSLPEIMERPTQDFLGAASIETLELMHERCQETGSCVAQAGSVSSKEFSLWLFASTLKHLVLNEDLATRALGDEFWKPAKLLEELGIEIRSPRGLVEWTRADSIRALPQSMRPHIGHKPRAPTPEEKEMINQAAKALSNAMRGPSAETIAQKLRCMESEAAFPAEPPEPSGPAPTAKTSISRPRRKP
ncbi:MAG: DEAD/DEAH box helicase family protein [Polaromonas sp.]|nr:DEAD/DEAH box helicase family protein [Polaromonas sp.]